MAFGLLIFVTNDALCNLDYHRHYLSVLRSALNDLRPVLA